MLGPKTPNPPRLERLDPLDRIPVGFPWEHPSLLLLFLVEFVVTLSWNEGLNRISEIDDGISTTGDLEAGVHDTHNQQPPKKHTQSTNHTKTTTCGGKPTMMTTTQGRFIDQIGGSGRSASVRWTRSDFGQTGYKWARLLIIPTVARGPVP